MQGGYIRQERPYVTFAALLVSEKYDERKVTLCLYGGSKPPPYAQSPSIANRQKKKSKSIPLFLLTKKAQKKKLQKRKRRKKISRSAEYLPSLGDADTHAPRMCQFPPLLVDDTAFFKRRAKTSIAAARKLYFGAAKIKLKHKAF